MPWKYGRNEIVMVKKTCKSIDRLIKNSLNATLLKSSETT